MGGWGYRREVLEVGEFWDGFRDVLKGIRKKEGFDRYFGINVVEIKERKGVGVEVRKKGFIWEMEWKCFVILFFM